MRFRRPVSRKQLREYRNWRAQTELTEDERNVRLPGTLGASLESADVPVRVRPPQKTYEERRREYLATAGPHFVLKGAIGFSAATIVSASVLPYGILTHDFTIAAFGVVLLPVFAPFCGYVAFSSWWEVRHGTPYEPPAWLRGLGRGLLRALSSNIGR